MNRFSRAKAWPLQPATIVPFVFLPILWIVFFVVLLETWEGGGKRISFPVGSYQSVWGFVCWGFWVFLFCWGVFWCFFLSWCLETFQSAWMINVVPPTCFMFVLKKQKQKPQFMFSKEPVRYPDWPCHVSFKLFFVCTKCIAKRKHFHRDEWNIQG